MPRRILLTTLGSLGDLHPYVAIARELARRGHVPVIASFDRFRAIVEAEGIAFAPVRPSEAQVGDPQSVMRRLVDGRRGAEYLVREIVMRYVRESYADIDRAAEGADLIVTHPITVTAPLVAQKRGVPWAATVLAPFSFMSVDDPPELGPAPWLRQLRRLGRWPYRLLFAAAKRSARGWEAPLDALRADLGLPPSAKQALFEGQFSPTLNLALFSPLLAQPQADWPANTQVCGFARYDGAAPDAAELARLDAFLAAGEPPIAFALGSSVALDPREFFAHAREAARMLGRRALLVTGGPPEDFGPDVAAFEYLPYSTVFPHAAAIVHPCGIGTLSQALAAGRPMLAMPVSFDQPDNARRAVGLGVARRLPFQKASAARVARELEAPLRDPDYRARAEDLGARIAAEDGAARACDLLLR